LRARRPRSEFAGTGSVGATLRLEQRDLAPHQPPERAQRLARAPDQAVRFARRDLAAPHRRHDHADCVGDFPGAVHAREIDAEEVSGMGPPRRPPHQRQ
jgi:hypothetical protein